MQRRIQNSPFDAHIKEITRLVKLEGVTDGGALSEIMGISQERIKGLAELAKVEVTNLQLKPVHRGRRKPDLRHPDLEALIRQEEQSIRDQD